MDSNRCYCTVQLGPAAYQPRHSNPDISTSRNFPQDGEKKANYWGSLCMASTVRLGNDLEGNAVHVPLRNLLPTVHPNDLVLGGWDICSDNLADAMVKASVLVRGKLAAFFFFFCVLRAACHSVWIVRDVSNMLVQANASVLSVCIFVKSLSKNIF